MSFVSRITEISPDGSRRTLRKSKRCKRAKRVMKAGRKVAREIAKC